MTECRPLSRHLDAWHECDLAPCGEAAALRWHHFSGRFSGPEPDLGNCLAVLRKPWLLTVWEPLATKAPGPHVASAYCCYINTVIFYHAPYVKSPWVHLYWSNGRLRPNSSAGHFEQWDQIETRLRWNDQVAFGADIFEYGGGRVIWTHAPGEGRRWWMRHGFRRVSEREAA